MTLKKLLLPFLPSRVVPSGFHGKTRFLTDSLFKALSLVDTGENAEEEG